MYRSAMIMQQLQLRVENEAVLSDLKIQKVDSRAAADQGRDFVFGLYADETCKTLIMKAHADQESATACFPDCAMAPIT